MNIFTLDYENKTAIKHHTGVSKTPKGRTYCGTFLMKLRTKQSFIRNFSALNRKLNLLGLKT